MKKLIFINIFSALLLLFPACNNQDFFELKRPPQFPWNTLDELDLATRETYRTIFQNAWANPIGEFTLMSYVSSDIAQLMPGTSGNLQWFEYYHRDFSFVTDGTRLGSIFNFCYQSITACNGPLDFLLVNEENGVIPFPGVSQKEYDVKAKQVKGELYFMRGLAYWYLARFFTPPYDPQGSNDDRLLSLKTNFSEDPEDARNPYIGTTQEIYDQIKSDWEMAKSLLDEQVSEGLANKYAASGMLYRFYFLTGDFAKAKAECDFIISSPNYTMNVDPIDAFSKNAGQNSPEVIFEFAGNREAGIADKCVTTMNKSHYAARNGGRGEDWSRVGWDQFTLSYKVLEDIGWMTDPVNGDYTVTDEAKVDKRYTQMWSRLEPFIQKPADMDEVTYKNTIETQYTWIETPQIWCDKYFRAEDGRYSHRPILRLAEIYLTRSILRFKDGDNTGSAEDLNVIRQRAGLDPIDSGVLTESDIHNERIKELGGEHGDRLLYLMALRMPLGAGDRDPSATNSTINPPYSDFYFKIPETERNLNGSY